MKRKEDIRIKKTRDKLKQGLLEILKTEDIDEVSVTELCKYSAVNRNTFYSHYKEPSDLLEEIEGELISSMYSTLANANLHNMSMYTFISSLFTQIYENKDICSIIFSPHGNKNLIRNIVEMVRTNVTSDWINKGVTELESNIMFSYCLSGALGVLESWINDNYRTPVSEISQILTSLILTGQSNSLS